MLFPLLSFYALKNEVNAQPLPESAYDALESEENGEKMRLLYAAFDKYAQDLLKSERDLEKGSAYTPQGIAEKHFAVPEGIFSGKTYGLSLEEVESVYMAYRADHPEAFFLPSVFLVDNAENGIRFLMEEKYFSGNTRKLTAEKIEKAAEKILSSVDEALSDYEKALYLHDFLANELFYRYESDGITPSMKADAHGLPGFAEKSGVVCDGYAKTYQYLLKKCGIPAFTVAGTTKGNPHAWNLVKSEYGWFWADLTFDDRPETSAGVFHAYFASPDAAFRRDHTVFGQTYGISYQCVLPEVSAAAPTYYRYTGSENPTLPDLEALARASLLGGNCTLEAAVPTEGAGDVISKLYARTYFGSAVRELYESYSFRAINCGDYTVLSIGFTSRRFDLDGDGYVTLSDAQILIDCVCGNLELDRETFGAADANGNGRFDIGDVCLLLDELP